MDRPIMSPSPPTIPEVTFTAEQWEALRRLRACYSREAEYLSPRELAHLHFLRWLYRSGRLDT